ncbi:UNVERIFIED_ORG: integrase [Burkholderia sp. 1263]
MAFDARKIKLMAPGTHVNIDGFPGLRIEATAVKRSWTYRYKSPIDGRMKQTKLGEWPAMTYASAITAWESARTTRSAGVDISAEKRKKRQGESEAKRPYTVRALCEDYISGHIERYRGATASTNARRLIRSGIKPIADLAPDSITRQQAYNLINGKSQSPTMAARLRSELGAAWEFAMDADKLPSATPNWWRQIMQGRLRTAGRLRAGTRSKDKRVLSDGELADLLAWLPLSPILLQDAVTLYLWTGTRGAEIMAMEGSEITTERDGAWWTIPKTKTKNVNVESATDHRVPLIGRALQIVERRKKEHGPGYLFPAKRVKSHTIQKTVQEMIYRCQPYSNVKRAYGAPTLTVTHWALHDLRRTIRTMLARLGCPHETAEAIIGHVLGGVAGVYNRHKYDNERREWLTRIDAELERLAGRKGS